MPRPRALARGAARIYPVALVLAAACGSVRNPGPAQGFPAGFAPEAASGAEAEIRAPWEPSFRPAAARPSRERLAFREEGGAFVAEVREGGLDFRWRLDPSRGELLRHIAIEDGGARILPMRGAWILPGENQARLVGRRLHDGRIHLDYADGVRVVIEALGRALCIDIHDSSGMGREERAISLGGLFASIGAEHLSALTVPFFDQGAVGVAVLRRGRVRYATAWLDPTRSHASDIQTRVPGEHGPEGELLHSQQAYYHPDTRGAVQALRERIWLAWSDELLDVLPKMDRPPSAGRAEAGRFYLDFNITPFDQAAGVLRELVALGARDCHVWMRHWQRDGYDRGYPDQVMPPNADWGGMEGLLDVRRAAAEAGWGFSLHHNWVFNGTRLEGATLLNSAGKPATLGGGDSGQYLKPARALELVDRVEGEIHQAFDTRGTFTDSLTAGLPPVDQEAGLASTGRILPALATWRALLERLRAIHGAPVCGEGTLGHGVALWSGAVDVMQGYLGFVNQEIDPRSMGARVDVVPDFNLARLNRVDLRAGLGDPPRFFHPAGGSIGREWTAEDRDRMISLGTALGVAGCHWSVPGTLAGDIAREWWSWSASSALLTAPGLALETVDYAEPEGGFAPLSRRLARGASLAQGDVRVRVRYEGGIQVLANLTDSAWRLEPNATGTDGAAEPGLALAPWGRLVLGPGFEAGLVLDQEHPLEYSRGADHLYLDARGAWVQRWGLGTDGAVALRRVGPREVRLFPIASYRRAIDPELRNGEELVIHTTAVRLDPALLGVDPAEPARLVLRGSGLAGSSEEVEERELAPGAWLELSVEALAGRGIRSIGVEAR